MYVLFEADKEGLGLMPQLKCQTVRLIVRRCIHDLVRVRRTRRTRDEVEMGHETLHKDCTVIASDVWTKKIT